MKKIAFYSLLFIFTGVTTLSALKSPSIAYGDSSYKKKQIDETSYIGLEKAKEIALNDLELKENQVSFIKNKLYQHRSIAVYDIDFIFDSIKYEYDIDAKTGTILEFSKEMTSRGNTSNTQLITLEQAKTISLEYAGLKSSDISIIKEQADHDNGRTEFEFEFTYQGIKYEFELLSDGTIYKYDYEIIPQTIIDSYPQQTGEQITLDQAKDIALKNSNLSKDQVAFTKTKLDYDDGYSEYEIEFVYNYIDYEYTIDAVTGKILDFEKDYS